MNHNLAARQLQSLKLMHALVAAAAHRAGRTEVAGRCAAGSGRRLAEIPARCAYCRPKSATQFASRFVNTSSQTPLISSSDNGGVTLRLSCSGSGRVLFQKKTIRPSDSFKKAGIGQRRMEKGAARLGPAVTAVLGEAAEMIVARRAQYHDQPVGKLGPPSVQAPNSPTSVRGEEASIRILPVFSILTTRQLSPSSSDSSTAEWSSY